jgi:ATP-dependent DNA ligase
VLISSYGNEFKFLGHIKEAIRSGFKLPELPLDGELYKHGWPFERIHSAASRKVNANEDTIDLEFHIFDYQGPGSQWQRIHNMVVKEKIGCFESPLIHVPYTVVTPDNWMEQSNRYTDDGYEGIILRSAIADYEKKRSSYILKFKPTEEDTYTIVGVKEAVSKEGVPKGMVGAFAVQGDDQVDFFVGAGKLDHAARERLWSNRGDLVGKMLKVKHEKDKTRGGVPICAVAVKVIE